MSGVSEFRPRVKKVELQLDLACRAQTFWEWFRVRLFTFWCSQLASDARAGAGRQGVDVETSD